MTLATPLRAVPASLVLSASLLLALPASAQEVPAVPPTVVPPAPLPTATPDAAAPTPAPVRTPTPAPSASASPTPVATRSPRRTAATPTPQPSATTTSEVTAAAEPPPSPQTPTAEPIAAPPVAAGPAPAPLTNVESTPAAAEGGQIGWIWAVVAAAFVLGGLAFALRRRRTSGAFGGQYEPEADYYSNRAPRAAVEAMPGLAQVDATGSPVVESDRTLR